MTRQPSLLSRLAWSAALIAVLAGVASCGGGGSGGSTNPKPNAIISIRDLSMSESGGVQQTVLTMINPTGVTCRLSISTADGTAQAGQDYVAISGAEVTMTTSTLFLPLTPLDDDLVESDETFSVAIALAPGSDPECTLDQRVATVTLTSEDVWSDISIADATFSESAATGQNRLTVSMTNPTGRSCSVLARTEDGTASSGSDYVAFADLRVDLGGLPSVSWPLEVVNDSTVESDEVLGVSIALAPNVDPRCRIVKSQATITIASDE